MALTDLTRISTSGIATGTSLSGAILHGDAHFRGTQVGVNSAIFDSSDDAPVSYTHLTLPTKA